MSVRARQARRLASILIRASGVHARVQYDRLEGRYSVHWQDGPTAETMWQVATRNAAQVPLLDIADLAWLRTESSRPERG
jgi:hypothetical protein